MSKHRIEQGHVVELEGIRYAVREVCRGEGQARANAREHPGRVYRVVRGQWCVLEKIQEAVPEYFFR